MNYIEFASKISFFEFTQTEFNKPHFKINNYSEEIDMLKGDLNIDKLTQLFETHPKSFDIFEEIFQLKRFTNTQYIHFCFLKVTILMKTFLSLVKESNGFF